MVLLPTFFFFFFFNDTATTEIYTLSLHDALPISFLLDEHMRPHRAEASLVRIEFDSHQLITALVIRSEEHTSELQSRPHLVCRLLLEKKKKKYMMLISMYNISADRLE